MKSEPKTILIIASLTESLILFRESLIKELVAHGYHVVACAAEKDPLSGIMGIDIARRIAECGATYVPVPMKRLGKNPVYDIRTLAALIRICRIYQPVGLLAYTTKPIILGILAGWLTKVKAKWALITGIGYGVTAEDSSNFMISKLIRWLLRASLFRCTGVIFQNSDDRQIFQDAGILPANISTLIVNGSGVDINHFKRVPFPEDHIAFLLTARLLKPKGIMEYMQAARIVKASYPSARFLLVGPIDDHPDKMDMNEIYRWESDGIGQWLGTKADIRTALAETSVYVLPSYHEGTPRTILEAMAMGRPIITTNVPGCRETVIVDKNGYLVPARDVGSLADAMRKFLDDPNLVSEMGECSRAIAEARYDVRVVNKQILKFMVTTCIDCVGGQGGR